jgi:hypothetical protein
MKDYFAEKAHQVDPNTLIAFGIELSSRYGDASEIKEMLTFAELVATDKVSHNVKKVFYDSKAGICSFELDPSIDSDGPVADMIRSAADKSLHQYFIFDELHQGLTYESRWSGGLVPGALPVALDRQADPSVAFIFQARPAQVRRLYLAKLARS